MQQPGGHAPDISAEQMIQDWARETVELAAAHGRTSIEAVVGMFNDPLLDSALRGIRVRRGEAVIDHSRTKTEREGVAGFVARTENVPEGARSWLNLLSARLSGKE
jgi:hypothetical protein